MQLKILWYAIWKTLQQHPVNSFWLLNPWCQIQMHLMQRIHWLMLQGMYMCIWLSVYQLGDQQCMCLFLLSLSFLTTIDTNFSEECYCILLFKYSHSNVTFRTRPFYWNECLADLASKRVLYPSCLRQLVWQLWSFYSCKRLFSLCYRAVTDSINMLLNACMSAAPGQKECDNALRNIQVWTYCAVSKIISLPTFKVLWYQYPDTKKLERGGWSNS